MTVCEWTLEKVSSLRDANLEEVSRKMGSLSSDVFPTQLDKDIPAISSSARNVQDTVM